MGTASRTCLWTVGVYALAAAAAAAGAVTQSKGDFVDKFRQLDEVLPTANVYRNAAGAPGADYWQQQVDYDIDVTLDEQARRISGSETITYHNNSPDTLRYLWLQLEQNAFRADSADARTRTLAEPERITFAELRRLQFLEKFDGGHRITRVADARGRPLPHVINGTLMRIDLPEPLESGKKIRFQVDWNYQLVEEDAVNARAGYEQFEDGNDIFLIAQWYPRLVAYTDYEGWHNKEFLGDGEFTVEFGDYQVDITVPADHVVSSTGVLANPGEVLSATQRRRLTDARDAERPVFIVTREEALANAAEGSDDQQTWRFSAGNVRDFAWASSRKFIWDAQGYRQEGAENQLVMAMSFYPEEGEPLWSRYSTQAVIHTMEVYSRYSFPYPYPVAQSVNGPVGGMEYPMITFNGPRTELQDDGTRTYSRAERRFLIGVVIHEIGHIYFPMTVNSDERQWTWMDEGVNSFLQFIAEQEWETDYPSRRGEPRWITDFMKSENQVPIMTNSESIMQFGNNAYAKPATALVVLRETILGRELFDFAFREYARRWKFKRPTPADLFRTLEDASGVDLDWFWRGWFYTTDHVDIAIDRVTHLKVDSKNPDVEKPWRREQHEAEPPSRTELANEAQGLVPRLERMPDLQDFYVENDPFTVSNKDRNDYQAYLEELHDPMSSNPDWRREVLERAVEQDRNYYVLEFSNVGGLVMPIILQLDYADGSSEELYLPAEIWRRSPQQVTRLLMREGEIERITLDPHWETADVDLYNNHYPRKILPSRLEVFEPPEEPGDIPDRDLMQDIKAELDGNRRKVETPDATTPAEQQRDLAVPMRDGG
ncbi:MAG: M1 family metallopeptidase [Gammaproteobacteria bacterium]|nr:M1 family metallopeptidase [Gammaproteobacteria bacterium]